MRRLRQRRDQAADRSGRHFPNEDAITRLVGAILLEQNDGWGVERGRYMTLETIAPRWAMIPPSAFRPN